MKNASARPSLGTALTLALALGAPAAWGNPCIQDARGEFRDCKAGCVEDFQVAKDACLNRDHSGWRGAGASGRAGAKARGSDKRSAPVTPRLRSGSRDVR